MGGDARRAPHSALRQDFLRRPGALRALVDRGGAHHRRAGGAEHPRSSRRTGGHSRGGGQGLLRPEGPRGRRGRTARDRPQAPRHLSRPQGPRSPRHPGIAPARHPRRREERGLRHRVRAAGRGRDRPDARRQPEAPPRHGRHFRGGFEASRTRAARPDCRRDRARPLEDVRGAAGLRRGGVPGDPRGEGADVPQGGGPRVRAPAGLALRCGRLRRPEGLAPQAPEALLSRCPGRGGSDPARDPPHGGLRLRKEPVREDDLDRVEPAALPPGHERDLRHRQPGGDVPEGAPVRRGGLTRRPLDRRDRDGGRGLPGRPGRLDVPHLLGLPDVDAGEERPRLRRGDGEPDPAPAGGDHPQGALRPGLLRRPARGGGAQADLPDSPRPQPLRRRPARHRVPGEGHGRLERRRDRAGRRVCRRGRLRREEGSHRGRPLQDDRGDGPPVGDDGGTDQGDPELGPRTGAERVPRVEEFGVGGAQGPADPNQQIRTDPRNRIGS